MITCSIEEFIGSSNVGEFKKRLNLLLAFHGQLNHGVVLKAYSRTFTAVARRSPARRSSRSVAAHGLLMRYRCPRVARGLSPPMDDFSSA
ncbi:hypothetical protein GW17_00013153 [Ensete ventricosum]|nr:hypothetical protein GW17_00013153 [Ensete ventricosum]